MRPLRDIRALCLLLALMLTPLLAACRSDVLPGREATGLGSSVAPRIVVQVGHRQRIEAVRWINHGANLVSIDANGFIVLWDVARGLVVDTAQIPATFAVIEPGRADQDRQELVFLSAIVSGDGQTLSISYARGPRADGRDAGGCPEAALADGGRWCSFSLDLASRKVIPAATYVPPVRKPSEDSPYADVPDELARFPLSPDGAWRPRQVEYDEAPKRIGAGAGTAAPQGGCAAQADCNYGISLEPMKGGAPRFLSSELRGFEDVAITADGLKLVKLNTIDGLGTTAASAFDLSAGANVSVVQADNAYHRVEWIDGEKFLMVSKGYDRANTLSISNGFPRAMVGTPECEGPDRACPTLPHYTFLAALAEPDEFIGYRPGDGCFGGLSPDEVACLESEGAQAAGEYTGRTLYRCQVGSDACQPVALNIPADSTITAMAVAPDRLHLAVATVQAEETGSLADRQTLRVYIFGIGNKGLSPVGVELFKTVHRREELFENYREVSWDAQDLQGQKREALQRGYLDFADGAHAIREIAFTSDSSTVFFAHTLRDGVEATTTILDAGGQRPPRRLAGTSRSVVAIGQSRILDLERQTVIDSLSGQEIGVLDLPGELITGGSVDRSSLIWVATRAGAILFFDVKDLEPVITLHLLADGGFFAVTPDGRYDTNLPPDTRAVRWLVPDAPFQSLEPQTFMRDYYEPGLYARMLACRAAANCEQAFKPLPPLAQVNRVLPKVSFVSAVPVDDGHAVTVTIDVAEGIDPAAANGKTRSGIYNPRLFINGQLVAMEGRPPDGFDDSLPAWRKANDMGRRRRFSWTVPVQTNGAAGRLEFDAYAFNEDRIKSETVHSGLTVTSLTARPRRAYVIAIGIDDYSEPRFRLHYAAADALVMAERLSRIPDRDVRTLVLAGRRATGNRPKAVARSTIANALGLLDRRKNRAALLAALRRDGFDGSAIEPATPDDLVIVSYSGHGWADVTGNFHLVPSDGGWAADGSPIVRRLFSSADFVNAILPIEAGRMALVIDACHSSASVANGRFKPGPMGNSGLGQLAWDKNLLVLAATQADDVAREDATLGQGLLTYALAREGLAPFGPKADSNGDGDVSLDEWLGYAMVRLPELSSQRSTRPDQTGPRGLQFSDGAAVAAPVRVQRPSLFDFHKVGAGVYLMRSGR